MADADFNTRRQAVEAFGPDPPSDLDPDSEAYKDWIDEQFAEIKTRLDLVEETVEGELATKEDVDNVAHINAQARSELFERVEELEAKITWGGAGYDQRIEILLRALVNRARELDDDHVFATVDEHKVSIGEAGDTVTLDGVYQLFEGAVSKRTCRRYMKEIAAKYQGCSLSKTTTGGWGGGSSKMRLTMDVDEFLDAHEKIMDESR
jgi:hypothetical protein